MRNDKITSNYEERFMQKSYFQIIDIPIIILWLAIIFILSNFVKSRIKNEEVKGYYNYALLFKLFLSLAIFALSWYVPVS